MKTINLITLSFFTLLPGLVLAADYEASTSWARRVEMSFSVSGIVKTIHVEAGSQVAKGNALLDLDQRIFDARKSEARAVLANMDEDLKEAKRELDRATELYDRTVLSEHDLQMAKNGYVKAKADYQKAQAGWVKAQLDKNNSTLHAPFDAVVIAQKAEVGQTIRAELKSPVVIILGESGKMRATARLTADQIINLKKGQAASVSVNGKSFKGSIKHIALEPVNGSYPVEVEFATGDVQLRAGLKATITL